MIVQAFARQSLADIALNAVSIYRLNFAAYLVVFSLPYAFENLLDIALGLERPWATDLLFLAVVVIIEICTFVAAIRLAAGSVDGNPVYLDEALRWMWRRPLLKIIAAALVATIGIVLGLALLILPGLVVLVRAIYVVLPFLFEGADIKTALQRTSTLVKGDFFHTAGIFLAFAGVPYIFAPLTLILVETESAALVVLTTLIGAAWAPLFPIATFLGYVEMRSLKDGYQPDDLHKDLVRTR